MTAPGSAHGLSSGVLIPSDFPLPCRDEAKTWAAIRQLDALASAQFGLPRMIHGSPSDTAEPHHLLDEDFDASVTTLAPPRPDNGRTAISFLLTKNKLVSCSP